MKKCFINSFLSFWFILFIYWSLKSWETRKYFFRALIFRATCLIETIEIFWDKKIIEFIEN